MATCKPASQDRKRGFATDIAARTETDLNKKCFRFLMIQGKNIVCNSSLEEISKFVCLGNK